MSPPAAPAAICPPTRRSTASMCFWTGWRTTSPSNAGFFGCLHLDKTISSRHRAIFRDIVPTGGEAAEPGAGDAAAERGTAAKARLIKEDTYDTTGSAPR